MKRVGGRVWGEPALRQPLLLQDFGDPAPSWQCWQHWSWLLSLSVPASPRPWHVTAAAPSVRAVFLSLAFPRQWFCWESLSGSITAHVVLVAACSLRWGFAGLAWLLSRLWCGMAAGSGRVSSAAHMENTLGNHKEWRWCLKKKKKNQPQKKKVICRGLRDGDVEAASCNFMWD